MWRASPLVCQGRLGRLTADVVTEEKNVLSLESIAAGLTVLVKH